MSAAELYQRDGPGTQILLNLPEIAEVIVFSGSKNIDNRSGGFDGRHPDGIVLSVSQNLVARGVTLHSPISLRTTSVMERTPTGWS